MLITFSKKKFTFIGIIILLGLSILFTYMKSIDTEGKPLGYIALVIDDVGYKGVGTKELLDLNIPITTAVIPFEPFTKEDAKDMHQANFQVILHLPMESYTGKKSWVGPRAITCDLSDDAIKKRVQEGLDQVKYAVGINNHMGSKAIEDERVVRNVLNVVKNQNIFFLDSRTNPKSVVSKVAQDMKVSYFERDIFLDHVRTPEYIQNQLNKLGSIALEKGYAIGIGHVGPQGGKITMEGIRKMIPVLRKRGIEFIYLSQIPTVISNK